MESDRDLVERVSQRDSQAFDTLMRRYGQQVLRCLCCIVHDEAAAEDLAQEVFLRLWQRASQWQGQGTLAPWLLRIATNLALNHLRSVRRRRQRSLELPSATRGSAEEDVAPAWMVDASTLGPDEALELAEQQELFRGLVDALPEEKREVLRMVREDEMDLASVAEALGIPVGTVKSRLHYAVRRLAGQWQEVRMEWENP